jgi:integrase
LRFRTEHHVDLEASTLQVSYALQRIKRPGKEKRRLELIAPKTDCSRRIIRLPQVAVSALHAHRARQEHERQVCGLRWRDGHGFYHEHRDHVGPTEHDLRHSAATLLLAQGVHPRYIMELLGHSSISLAMNTYGRIPSKR